MGEVIAFPVKRRKRQRADGIGDSSAPAFARPIPFEAGYAANPTGHGRRVHVIARAFQVFFNRGAGPVPGHRVYDALCGAQMTKVRTYRNAGDSGKPLCPKCAQKLKALAEH